MICAPKKNRVILVGNGAGCLGAGLGPEIDSGRYDVVRFNMYRTAGFERDVGTRTDVHVLSGGLYVQGVNFASGVPQKLIAEPARSDNHKRVAARRASSELGTVGVLPDRTGLFWPSTGFIAIQNYVAAGVPVYLLGFDQDSRHYWTSAGGREARGFGGHDAARERRVIAEYIRAGRAFVLGKSNPPYPDAPEYGK